MTERIRVLQNLFLYGSTCRYYQTYSGTSYLKLVLRSISWHYGTYTCINELILVFQILCTSYRAYRLILVLRNLYWYYETYTGISELILILRNLYWSYGTYTDLTELILVLRNLYWSYGNYTDLTELILVLQNLLLAYGSYSCTKAPIGTISRNRSGSYHIQSQIRLLQIRTLVLRRYRS